MKLAYSLEEAEAATGYSQRTLRRAIADDKLIARYANSKPVITADELKNWLDNLPTEAPVK